MGEADGTLFYYHFQREPSHSGNTGSDAGNCATTAADISGKSLGDYNCHNSRQWAGRRDRKVGNGNHLATLNLRGILASTLRVHSLYSKRLQALASKE